MNLNKYKILFIIVLVTVSSCAYYNTFFNAKQSYELAQKKRKSTKNIKISAESKKNYESTIKKCWKLIDVYGDSSKYAPAALLLIGKSHYQMEEYAKAEHIFEQFIPKYPDSKFVPEANLWLARSYIQENKDPLALNLLRDFFQDNKPSRKIASEAFYVLGELYIKIDKKEKAIENLKKCIKITDNDELAGGAQYLIAKNFFDNGEFENSIASFKKTIKHDLPIMQHYYSLMYIVDCHDSLRNYDKSEILLKKMLRDERFKDQFGLIETRLVNVYEEQNASIPFIIDSYRDVILKYKKKEGAAAASYCLAQVFEYDLGKLDSAEFYYENVKKEYPNADVVQEAETRKNLLAEYLRIHNQIVQDKKDLIQLAKGDSLSTVIVDSLNTDKIDENNEAKTEKLSTDTETTGAFAENNDDMQNRKRPTIDKNTNAEKKKVEKVVKLRKPDIINKSLNKNSFSLGEFFLLKYQNYDSAEVAFNYYVDNFSDSLLIPKALYSLYYIYSTIHKDSIKSDSIKKSIIDEYPNTIYAKKLQGLKEDEKVPDLLQIELHAKFREGEKYIDKKQYNQAVKSFLEAAERDTSNSTIKEKSLYAIAYTYEKYIGNVDSAVYYYKTLSEQYPGTEYAKIAMEKTKIPEPEKIVSDSLSATDSLDTVKADSLNSVVVSDSLELSATENESEFAASDSSKKVVSDSLKSTGIRKEKILNKRLR